MNTVGALQLEANFDQVGRYAQDEINGFPEELIDELIRISLEGACDSWLDAMAGDGNLSRRMFSWCLRHGVKPPSQTTVLDYSRVQTAFAEESLRARGTNAIWGDLIGCRDRESGAPLKHESYDTITVKSGNHEIQRSNQPALHKNIFNLLKPGGKFVNLGFTFDSEQERDEFLVITNVKDSLAGLSMLVENRYFMTRQELHGVLADAGFTEITSALPCHYIIRSKVAAKNYFTPDEDEEKHLTLQAAQIRARKLRSNGRIRFGRNGSVMYLPAEITVARKPQEHPINEIYRKYPYKLLRKLDCHRQLMSDVAAALPTAGKLLDLGCGPGFLTKHISNKAIDYTGVDISPEFIKDAESDTHSLPTHFVCANINVYQPAQASYDAATLINVVYQEGIDAPKVISAALSSLKPGGRLIVTGPLGDGLTTLLDGIKRQMMRDHLLPEHADDFEKIKAANQKLLSGRANFWSLEGMTELILKLGASRIVDAHTRLYYDTGYFICAEK